jgi:hypothetical protein
MSAQNSPRLPGTPPTADGADALSKMSKEQLLQMVTKLASKHEVVAQEISTLAAEVCQKFSYRCMCVCVACAQVVHELV